MAAGDQGPTVGVAVVTHRAREHLARCLPPLLRSPLRPRVLVVNSSSDDGTVEEARRLGAEVLVVPRGEFNHGLTREQARQVLGTPVVVMLTPDAYPIDDGFLERLTAPVREGRAAVAYGRQVAREGADLIERFGRDFSYPTVSHVRGQADRAEFGSYLHFCSNACAAWSSAALDGIGGFPPTLVSEETIAAARLLRDGHEVAYVAEAVVVHSHRHGLADEVRRHFDIGFARARAGGLLRGGGGGGRGRGDLDRGRAFARALLALAWRDQPLSVPGVALRLGAKYLGYRAGLLGPSLPVAVARRLSGQDYYWDTAAARGRGAEESGSGSLGVAA